MRRALALGLTGVALAMSAAVGVARASAIHQHPSRSLAEAEARTRAQWSGYLNGGPRAWATTEHPPVTPALFRAIWQALDSGKGAGDPLVAFLLWRQHLDPARFNRYHPEFVTALRHARHARIPSPPLVIPTPPTTGGTPTTGGSSPTPPPTEPQILIPTPTPEPGTMLIAAGMAAWAVVWTRRRAR